MMAYMQKVLKERTKQYLHCCSSTRTVTWWRRDEFRFHGWMLRWLCYVVGCFRITFKNNFFAFMVNVFFAIRGFGINYINLYEISLIFISYYFQKLMVNLMCFVHKINKNEINFLKGCYTHLKRKKHSFFSLDFKEYKGENWEEWKSFFYSKWYLF